MDKSVIDLWANFLYNEKLDANRVDEASMMKLIQLCEALAAKQGPICRPHAKKLESRRLVCDTAMDLGIDLLAIKSNYNGKFLIGRGLLDAWTKAYAERYGSTVGTRGWKETKRRDVKTRLAKQRDLEEAVIQLGDSVRYSPMFLRSTGQYTGEIAFAKGIVTALTELSSETILATITWPNGEDLPEKVNTKNLEKIKERKMDHGSQ